MAEYKLPEEKSVDDFDKFVGKTQPRREIVERLGQDYVLPKGTGRMDESTQRSPRPDRPYIPDDLEIMQQDTTDDERKSNDLYRGHRSYFDQDEQSRVPQKIKARGLHIINHCIIT